jgi:hypothetical protein
MVMISVVVEFEDAIFFGFEVCSLLASAARSLDLAFFAPLDDLLFGEPRPGASTLIFPFVEGNGEDVGIVGRFFIGTSSGPGEGMFTEVDFEVSRFGEVGNFLISAFSCETT